jgi:hypothetical protein
MAFGISCADVLSISRFASGIHEQYLYGRLESTRLQCRQMLCEVEMIAEACESVAHSLE